MEDYDYVMMVDENGSPYLAHVDWGKARQSVRNAASSAAGAVKSAGKKSYKYYQKLKEGGKTLYFYSADELKAHYDNLRRQASGAVDKAKKTAANVRDNAQVAMTSARRKADDLRGKAAQTAAKARQTADNMRSEFARRADQVGAAANNAVASVKDKAGVDERERRDAAKKAADEAQARYDNAQDRLDEAHELRADAKRNGGAGLSKAEELVRGAAREREAARKDNEAKQKAYREAQSEYDATALGKGDRAREAVGNAIDSAQEGARKAVDASKSKFDRMKDDFAKKAGQAKEAAKNRTDKIKETADKAISNIKAASKDIEDAVSDIKEKIKYEAGGKYEEILPELEKTNEYARNKWYSAVDEYTSIKKQKSDAEDLYNWGMSELAKAKEKLDNTSPYSIEGIKAKKEYNSIVKAVNNAADDYVLLSTLEKDADKACEEARAQYAKANDIYSTVKDADDRSLLNVSRRAGIAIDNAVDPIRRGASKAATSVKTTAENIATSAKQTASNAKDAASRAVASVKDKAGVDERERRDTTKQELDETRARYDNAQDYLDEMTTMRDSARRNGGVGLSRAEELVREAEADVRALRKETGAKQKAYNKAQSEYDATALGKGDKAKEAAGEAVSGIREVWNKLSSGKTLTKKDREILNEYNRQNR